MISVQRAREIRVNPVSFSEYRTKIDDPIDWDLVFRGRCRLTFGLSEEVVGRLKEEFERGGWKVVVCQTGGYIEIRE